MSKLYYHFPKRVIDRFLSKHKNEDYEIRVISRRELNRLRRNGIKVYILGTIDRIGGQQKPVPVKLKRFITLGGAQPPVRHNSRIICSCGGDDSQGDNGSILDVFSSHGIDSSGGSISSYYDSVNDEYLIVVIVKPKNESDRILLNLLSRHILSKNIRMNEDDASQSNKTDNDEDRVFMLRLYRFFKDNDKEKAEDFYDTIKGMDDKYVINCVREARDKHDIIDTSKQLWKLLHDAYLYKAGYKNWNAQLNKR